MSGMLNVKARTCGRVNVSKPRNSAETEYVPILIGVKVYVPLSDVVVERTSPVCSFVRVTRARAITASWVDGYQNGPFSSWAYSTGT